jgi:hypothetical protein
MTLNTTGLDAFIAGLPGAIDAGVQETSEKVLELRLPLVPVDEGDLRDSGHIEGEAGSGARQVVEGTGLPDARAIYTEYGTDKAPVQAHMTPAATQTNAAAIVTKHIQELAGKSHI